MKVREERTGWRDQRISARHRAWGYDCPALDIDFLLLEYDAGKAVALVEYKHEDAPAVRRSHPSIQAIIDLADRAGLPAFVVRYADNFAWWYVIPLNDHARTVFAAEGFLNEAGWVELLYRCRGRALPADWCRMN
jgi:hypothetical protein